MQKTEKEKVIERVQQTPTTAAAFNARIAKELKEKREGLNNLKIKK